VGRGGWGQSTSSTLATCNRPGLRLQHFEDFACRSFVRNHEAIIYQKPSLLSDLALQGLLSTRFGKFECLSRISNALSAFFFLSSSFAPCASNRAGRMRCVMAYQVKLSSFSSRLPRWILARTAARTSSARAPGPQTLTIVAPILVGMTSSITAPGSARP
jgi:hypothetical protein